MLRFFVDQLPDPRSHIRDLQPVYHGVSFGEPASGLSLFRWLRPHAIWWLCFEEGWLGGSVCVQIR